MWWGRAYFAVQAVAGAAWWVGVFASPFVRRATLGGLDPVVVAAVDLPLFVGASALAAVGLRAAAVTATVWTAIVTVGLAGYATVTGQAGIGVLIMVAALVASGVALCLMLLGRVPTAWVASGPFGFRPADDAAPPARHVARTAAQVVVFWGFFLAVVPFVIVVVEQRWQLDLAFSSPVRIAGAVLLVLASTLGLWSAVTMSTTGGGTPLPSAMPNRLVVAGPYLLVRNPMAVAGVAQGVGVGLLASSWLVVVYALVGSIVWNTVVRPLEEADLEARFGADYRAYRSRVRCWWPRGRTGLSREAPR